MVIFRDIFNEPNKELTLAQPYLYRKYNVNNDIFTIKLIIPATISELSLIKNPCNNQRRFVISMSNNEYRDKSFTLWVI